MNFSSAKQLEIRTACDSAQEMIRTLQVLGGFAEVLHSDWTPELVAPFQNMFKILLDGTGKLQAALPNRVLCEFTSVQPNLLRACGQSAQNAHQLVFDIADSTTLNLTGALGTQPAAEPGALLLSELSNANYERVQEVLARLAPDDLARLSALCKRERDLACHEGVSRGLEPSSDVEAGKAGTVLDLDEVNSDPNRWAYTADCRCVNWYGREFSFTAIQAACLKLLVETYRNGVPEIGEQAILTDPRVDSSQQHLSHVFDKARHPAWGTMIKPGKTKGTFRLAKPNE